MPKNHQNHSVTVKAIQALKGGGFEETVSVGCDTQQHAQITADRLQREFDADGDPCRTYVYKGDDPVPVYAGLATFFYHKTKDFNRQGRTQRMN
jgi:hypothetical protein